MPIRIVCLDCGFSRRVRDRLAGLVVECPRCRAGIEVPRRAEPPSAAEPPTDRGRAEPPSAELIPVPDFEDGTDESSPTAEIVEEDDP